MKILLSELKPNPFRHLKRLPTKPEKVETLKQSIKDTSFWDNLVCRRAPNGAGGYEIAYGHNRLEALRQLKYESIDIPVRDLSNTTMAKIMARENHEEWGAYAEVDAETVFSIIEAFGRGQIELARADRMTRMARIAPNFELVPISSPDESKAVYTNDTLSRFLGWPKEKVERILTLLSFRETTSVGKKIDFSLLTSTQAQKVVVEIRRVIRETEDEALAKKIGTQLANDFRLSADKARTRFNKNNRAVSTETASERTNQLMREAKVKLFVAKKKQKKDALDLQKEDRQVANFLDACKAWSEALDKVSIALSKFSPEARGFTTRRLNEVHRKELLLKEALK